ncbi:MAG: hypothetical protein M1826_002127 [Phylliscum demangeonii]|nr:MAG: hypothetical protein M1826_002127 [Phylliscum demangeonii]
MPYRDRDRSNKGDRHQKKKTPPIALPSPPPTSDEDSPPSSYVGSPTSRGLTPPPLSGLLTPPSSPPDETAQRPLSKSPSRLPSSPSPSPSPSEDETVWSPPPGSTPSSPPPPSSPHDGTARKQIGLAPGEQVLDQVPPPQSLETRSTMVNQDGLGWKYALFDYEPTWVREPSTEVIESLARKHLSLPLADRCDVVFHAEDGGFHKLFRVIPGGGVGTGYIMRVALPVDPPFLTSSEVATMEYIRSCTTIPIPKIVAYDSSNRNALGFEWILMECVHGTRLEELWNDLPMATKERLARQLARFQAELFTKPRSQIGNLYRDPISPTPSQYPISRIVQCDFFWEQDIHSPVPRGPFKDSYTWLSARLALLRIKYERELASPDFDESDRGITSCVLSIVQKLLKLLSSLFPPDQPESTFVVNYDFDMDNLLVDEDGVITAVPGWACASVLPDWCACQLPNLLRGCERAEPPDPEMLPYNHWGETNPLYWEQTMDYETTLLRPIFLDEMQRLCPDWVNVMRGSELRTDFEMAVSCLNEFRARTIDAWLDSFVNGHPGWSLGF